MHYIITVHSDSTWIEIQQRQLELFGLKENCKTIATVQNPGENGFDEEWPDRSIKNTTSISHQSNLNFLMKKVLAQAGDKDVLIFLDGDAFPVDSLEIALKFLEEFQAVGILEFKRKRRRIKRFLHTSFMAIGVGLWKKLGMAWGPGKGHFGLNDTCGKVNEILMKKKVNWKGLERTNKTEITQPPSFGIYGNVIYHHYSGFRPVEHILGFERRIVKAVWGIKNYKQGHKEYSEWKCRIWDLMYEQIKKSPDFYKLMI